MNTNTMSVGTKIPKEMLVLIESRSTVVKVTFRKNVTSEMDKLFMSPRRRNISMSNGDWIIFIRFLGTGKWPKTSRELEITITGNSDEKRGVVRLLIAVAEKIEGVS